MKHPVWAPSMISKWKNAPCFQLRTGAGDCRRRRPDRRCGPRRGHHRHVTAVGQRRWQPTEVERIAEAVRGNAEPLLEWPRRGQEPVNEYGHVGLFTQAFPTLFPMASADISHVNPACPRVKTIEFGEWLAHLMSLEDGRYARHPRFRYYAWNLLQRKGAAQTGRVFLRRDEEARGIPAEELQELLAGGNRSVEHQLNYFSQGPIILLLQQPARDPAVEARSPTRAAGSHQGGWHADLFLHHQRSRSSLAGPAAVNDAARGRSGWRQRSGRRQERARRAKPTRRRRLFLASSSALSGAPGTQAPSARMTSAATSRRRPITRSWPTQLSPYHRPADIHASYAMVRLMIRPTIWPSWWTSPTGIGDVAPPPASKRNVASSSARPASQKNCAPNPPSSRMLVRAGTNMHLPETIQSSTLSRAVGSSFSAPIWTWSPSSQSTLWCSISPNTSPRTNQSAILCRRWPRRSCNSSQQTPNQQERDRPTHWP